MTPLPRDLPVDTEKALEAVANGWTRTATTAHPDCLCGGRAQACPVTFVERNGEVWVLNPRYARVKTIPCPIHTRRK